jgi:hypothetical protein
MLHPSDHEFTERTHDPPSESEVKAILQELDIATDNNDSDSSSEPEETTARRARRSRGRRLFRSATFDLDSSDDD